jgi:hypothetical protein
MSVSPFRSLALLGALTALAPLALAEIRYVDASLTTGLGDGTSWADAFQGSAGLQTALAAAVAGDQIFVAQGLYRPTETTTRSISFALKNGVELYGGFLGTEATPAERPPFHSAPSVLSGDLLGDDGSGLFGDNSFHLLTTAGTNATAVIDGFVVRGGAATGGGGNNDRGGGILCVGAVSPTVRHCRFENNRSTFGGAAGYINNGAAPTFTDCAFVGGVGGSFGGAFDIASGGAVRFDRCSFEGNTAARAGALEIFATTGVVVSNCLFRNNTATGSGGGGGLWMGSGGNTRVVNCTFLENNSTTNAVAGLRNQGATNAVVINCVFWDNSGPSGAQGPSNQVNAGTNVTYSVVEGGFLGTGNSSADPRFVDQAGGDLRPGYLSPCIDAGNSAEVPAGANFDLAGAPRAVDHPQVADSGAGGSPAVDLGAFEAQPQAFVPIAGCAGNGSELGTVQPELLLGTTVDFVLATAAPDSLIAFFYLGVPGTDANGCGLPLPPLGDVLLGLAPFPLRIATVPVVLGSAVHSAPVPNDPNLVGLAIAVQTLDSTVLAPATNQFSNAVTAVFGS